MSITVLFCALILLFLPTLPAQAANPGDSCTAAQTGFVQTDAGTVIICDGTTWNLALLLSSTAGRILFQVDNDAGSCTVAKKGRLKYNESATPPWQ
jgi:hypothetical protein